MSHIPRSTADVARSPVFRPLARRLRSRHRCVTAGTCSSVSRRLPLAVGRGSKRGTMSCSTSPKRRRTRRSRRRQEWQVEGETRSRRCWLGRREATALRSPSDEDEKETRGNKALHDIYEHTHTQRTGRKHRVSFLDDVRPMPSCGLASPWSRITAHIPSYLSFLMRSTSTDVLLALGPEPS